jgi:hypothetical protein
LRDVGGFHIAGVQGRNVLKTLLQRRYPHHGWFYLALWLGLAATATALYLTGNAY